MDVPISFRKKSRALLVDLLKQAARLEHSLLNSYLYAACSIKSTPQEWATVGDGDSKKPNRRRGIQFERARLWKLKILNIAHEEMLHLHYVQCLLRALGEPPHFKLPNRTNTGNWVIPNWNISIEGENVRDEGGVEIPVQGATEENIQNFVLYESTDALQDTGPFDDVAREVYKLLYNFESDFLLESSFLHVEDQKRRNQLKKKIRDLYEKLLPVPEDEKSAGLEAAAVAARELPPASKIQFQSIAELYQKGILPLYKQAFEFGFVKNTNYDLNMELQDEKYAGQGRLPIGPTSRGRNFETFSNENVRDPLLNNKDVKEIIKEIVEEGEGIGNFLPRAKEFLEKVDECGGARWYLSILKSAKKEKTELPTCAQEGELLRKSHLYRFVMIYVEFLKEKDLASQVGMPFQAHREPVDAKKSLMLRKITEELPLHFNVVFLVVVAWLSRIYEVEYWLRDKRERQAIESLATFPLMTIGVRPFLELASFFPIDKSKMFKLSTETLPKLPTRAQQLLELYLSPERSQEVNITMDFYAVGALSDVAVWAAEYRSNWVIPDDLDSHTCNLILNRLEGLSVLDEFGKQYRFRKHGGIYSTLPDRTYWKGQPNSEKKKYEERPPSKRADEDDKPPLPYKDTFVLRLRFAGWGLVQIATDVDPTFDEAGCTGTHMLHASDGDRCFNRACVWQPDTEATAIVREPRAGLPTLGVNVTNATLLVTDGEAYANYKPLPVSNAKTAILADDLNRVLEVRGFDEVKSLSPESFTKADNPFPLRVNLKKKDGAVPALIGLNQLIWKYGEPIDPFIIEVTHPNKEFLLQREIYNLGETLLDMDPLQRLYTSRAPVGRVHNFTDSPDWALDHLVKQNPPFGKQPGNAMAYLACRASQLVKSLEKTLNESKQCTRENVDEISSLVDRLRLISVPPRETTRRWLTSKVNYGHSISGAMRYRSKNNGVLNALGCSTGIDLSPKDCQICEDQRDERNSRWLIGYSLGAMDTDALSNAIYGELYIPLDAAPKNEPVTLSWKWNFALSVSEAVGQYAAKFDKPFWSKYVVHGKIRTTCLSDKTELKEELCEQKDDSYRYSQCGLRGVSKFLGEFAITETNENAQLSWAITFHCSGDVLTKTVSFYSNVADTMEENLTKRFSPEKCSSGFECS